MNPTLSPLEVQRPETLVEAVANRLVRYIAENRLGPGDRLPTERELVQMTGVSRLPLREALCMLKGLGVIEARQGKGIFVRPLDLVAVFSMLSPLLRSSAEISPADMLEARQLLEPSIAARAAEHRSAEDVETLRDCIARMEACVENQKAFVEPDVAFHQCLARASGNPVLHVFAVALTDLLREVQYLFPDKPEYRRGSLHYHRAVFEAIEAGDAAAAENAMRNHIGDVQERI